LGGGIEDGSAAVLHRLAAGGVAFVRRRRRVRGDQPHPRRVDDKFLRCHLDQRRLDALPEFHLAGEYGDAAVRVDPDPRVEHRLVLETARKHRLLDRNLPAVLRQVLDGFLLVRLCVDELRQQGERYDERPAPPQEAPPRQPDPSVAADSGGAGVGVLLVHGLR
jgi:hypothetical protein